MPKILITGNGFDLFHNLPTKYQHFMSIMKTIESNDFADKVSFEVLFGNEFRSDSPLDFEKITGNFKVSEIYFDSDKLSQIKEILTSNSWYAYFKTVLQIDTWIDFELEIKIVLDQILIFDSLSLSSAIVKNTFSPKSIAFTSLEILEKFDILSFGANRSVFSLYERYLNKRISKIETKLMYDDLEKMFKDFVGVFNRYLADVVNVFYLNTNCKLEIPFQLINHIYTFNYTPTLEVIYSISETKISYLHGKITDDYDKHNLVFGVSEVSYEAIAVKSRGFTKYYQRTFNNLNSSISNLPNHNQDEQTIYYIIGHSLNESDRSYFGELFKFLENDRLENSKICVFFFGDGDKKQKTNNIYSMVDKELVNKLVEGNRLYFIELNHTNIISEFQTVLSIEKQENYFF